MSSRSLSTSCPAADGGNERRHPVTDVADGWISPFSPGWPWFNARIGLQYTWYEQFAGTSVNASSNNTLFAYIWLAM